MEQQITMKQHYIPRMILKNFAFLSSQKSKVKFLTYRFDKNKNDENVVNIKDICYENYLYEIKDGTGKIIEMNLIENNFSKLENQWNRIICKIKVKNKLTKDEENLMGLLVVLQIMRTPNFISFTSDWLQSSAKELGKDLNRYEANQYTKLASFIWGETKPETNWILDLMLKNILEGKEIVVYCTKSKFILNGENPVSYLNLKPPAAISDINWILPITEHHCIGIIDKRSSLYMEVNNEVTQFFNRQIFLAGGSFICSSFSILKDNHFEEIIKEFNNENNKNNSNS